MISNLPPYAIYFAAALVALVLRGKTRSVFLVLVPVLGLIQFLLLDQANTSCTIHVLEYDLELLRLDSTSWIFGVLFNVAAFIGMIYSLHLRDPAQQLAALLYAGSAMVVVFAGDLITAFIGWELLALTSVVLIWARRSQSSLRAGLRYLVAQLCSGLMLLTGILLFVHAGESLEFNDIGLTGEGPRRWGATLIFLAFGVKCAFPLLHNWLTDGYPEGTATGTVFLSGFTTKVAVYAMARGFAGTEELIWIGAAMALFPIFYAVIENDLRRVLGYSMINQIGFMMVGVGVGGLGLDGAIAHAFNDVFFKGVLFMSMGAVLLRTGTVNGSELGGLYKSMPLTTGLCMVGAASISAFPLFSGFVSKSMIMVALAEHSAHLLPTGQFDIVWFVLLFASAGVFHHAGIKIPYFAFFAHDSGKRVKEAPVNMLVAMVLGAAICIFIGCNPTLLYEYLPGRAMMHVGGEFVQYDPYTWLHVITQTQLLFFAALAFTFLMLTKLYPPELRSVNLDSDWFYRRSVRPVMALVRGPLTALGSGFKTLALDVVPAAVVEVANNNLSVRISRKMQFEVALLLVIVMLLSYLLYNFVV